MSIFFKARGTNSAGLFIVRIVLGTYTLALGITQANNVQLYIDRIKASNMLGENLAFIAGFVLPFALIFFGSLYIIGFFTPISSFFLSLIMLGKIIARGVFQPTGVPFNKDIIILACFLLTLFAGAGVISFDALLDKKKKVKPEPVKSTPAASTVTAEVVTDKPKENPPK